MDAFHFDITSFCFYLNLICKIFENLAESLACLLARRFLPLKVRGRSVRFNILGYRKPEYSRQNLWPFSPCDPRPLQLGSPLSVAHLSNRITSVGRTAYVRLLSIYRDSENWPLQYWLRIITVNRSVVRNWLGMNMSLRILAVLMFEIHDIFFQHSQFGT
jgi:hypothetical protein